MNPKLQQYIFTFEQGGWNTVWALNKIDALNKAKKEWNCDTLTIMDESITIATDEGLESAMSTFY